MKPYAATGRRVDDVTGKPYVVGVHPSNPDWMVRVDVDEELPAIVGLRLERRTGTAPEAITVELLRELQLSELAAAVNRHLAHGRVAGRIPTPGIERDGRFWAVWAAQYVRACEKAPRAPLRYLEDRIAGYSRDQLRDIVHQCRARGFLTKGAAGVARGALTQRARDALERGGK